MTENSATVRRYELSGGGVVSVYTPFGTGKYFAIVEQDGVYPEPGKIAVNRGRQEYSVVLDGAFSYEVDGVAQQLPKGASLLVGEGQRYRISGKGRVLVFVDDKPGGATVIEAA